MERERERKRKRGGGRIVREGMIEAIAAAREAEGDKKIGGCVSSRR